MRFRWVWWLPLAGTACLPQTPLALSGREGNYANPGHGLWWSVADPNGIHEPVIAVEQPISPGRVRQWIIDDRGVRIFLYDRQGQRSESPPVVADRMSGEFELVVSLVRSRFGHPDEPGWPGGPLPADQVNAMRCPADLVDLLEAHWPDRRVSPPTGMSHHHVREAAGTGSFRLSDLLEAGL